MLIGGGKKVEILYWSVDGLPSVGHKRATTREPLVVFHWVVVRRNGPLVVTSSGACNGVAINGS